MADLPDCQEVLSPQRMVRSGSTESLKDCFSISIGKI